MSGSYNTACTACRLLREQGFQTPVTVWDSLQVSFGLAYLVRTAARLAAGGADAAAIVAALEALRPERRRLFCDGIA